VCQKGVHQALTKAVTSGSSPTCRLQWPCSAGSKLAPAAVFLASDAACFVNGHILYVDGGVTATL